MMAEGGNGSTYSAAQVLDLLEETDLDEEMEMEMDDIDDINEPVCDGSDDDLGIHLDSEDEER